MSGFTSYDGIPCECPACGAKVADYNAHMTILWRNQHGAAIRIFCNVCGQWTDRSITLLNGLADRVVDHSIPHPTYAERQFGL